MNTKPPKYAYIVAVILGLLAFLIPANEPFYITLAIVFLIAGGLFGFLWPGETWRWGLWIAGPMVFFLGLSVLFAGQLDIFLKKDLPPLLISMIAACLGSFISSWFKIKQNVSR